MSTYAPAPTVVPLPRELPSTTAPAPDRDSVANALAGTTQDHRARIGPEVLADGERRTAGLHRAQGSTECDSETGLGDRADVDLLRGDGWLTLVAQDGVAPTQSVSDLAGSGHERDPTGRPARNRARVPGPDRGGASGTPVRGPEARGSGVAAVAEPGCCPAPSTAARLPLKTVVTAGSIPGLAPVADWPW